MQRTIMVLNRGKAAALGAITGIGAFAAGYVLEWILAGTKAAQLAVEGPFGTGVAEWKTLLWVYFDSHFVGTRLPEVTGPGDGFRVGGGVVDTVGLLQIEYLYLVPIAVLLVGGGILAWRVGSREPYDGMRRGMFVIVGYLPIAVLAMMVGQQSGFGPSPFRSLAIAGLVYPLVFGAIGGAVYGLSGGEAADQRGDPPSQ
ncbi:MAG: hypothetical protein V5A43_08515 [Haloarculaceae archaeon]